MKILEILIEDEMVGRAHLTHPEDLIYIAGSQGAKFALQAIENTVSNPKTITIKYDGYPAIIWGYDNQLQFGVMDKHMFNKGVRTLGTSRDFINYDMQRGADRTNLHRALAAVWPSLQTSTPKQPGYYWGDMLFTEPLTIKPDGTYTFRANPKGIIYKVQADSTIGKLLAGKQAGIAVHQIINANAANLDQENAAASLNGTLGGLRPAGNLAILPSEMPITPELKVNKRLLSSATSTVNSLGSEVDKLFDASPISLNVLRTYYLSPFINQQIIGQQNFSNLLPRFQQFAQARAKNERAKQVMDNYILSNQKGFLALFKIWLAILNLKESLIPQLDKASQSSPVQGYLESGDPSQEGYVANGVKFVRRLGGFAAQIHSAR